MCGIVGIASVSSVIDRSCIKIGLDRMQHRGPDDDGEWWSKDGCVGLGHRRLSIIDTSRAGRQPMQDFHKRLCVSFNGEIYNHSTLRDELIVKGYKFQSRSDTEVILNAYSEWGTDCLSRLNGMFAFSIYDYNERKLFLARDRAGEKPLFYLHRNGILRFASELKALLSDPSVPRKINPDALDCYLSMGYVPKDMCILQGIKKLPAAHALVFDLAKGDVDEWCYWEIPQFDISSIDTHADESTLINELECLLEASVKRQLVADVPVGVLLSGGVDSSLITAMAARSSTTVKTFTVRFPGYKDYDETKHARLISNHFGTEHIELDSAEVDVSLMPLLAKQFDEPINDSSMIPTYLVTNMISKYCTVALGGDGADELFGGYGHYDRLLWLQKYSRCLPAFSRKMVASIAGKVLPVGYKGRNWLQALDADLSKEVPLIASYFDRNTRLKLMAKYSPWNLSAEITRKNLTPDVPDLLQRATRMDFGNYLAEDILVKVDRCSMMNSLELRSPFLDHNLIEFSYKKVPAQLKATYGNRKILLKKLAAKLLPPSFDINRKQGFSVPLDSWIKTGPWESYFREILLGTDDSIFDRNVVAKLFDGQKKGYKNGERLFSLVLFELWRREYNITI